VTPVDPEVVLEVAVANVVVTPKTRVTAKIEVVADASVANAVRART